MKLGSSVWGRPTPPRPGSDHASSRSATPPSSPGGSAHGGSGGGSARGGARPSPGGLGDASLLLLRALAQKLIEDEPTTHDVALRHACEDALGVARDSSAPDDMFGALPVDDAPPAPDAAEVAVRPRRTRARAPPCPPSPLPWP